MSAPEYITVWACKEPDCSYWRPQKSTGIHMADPPHDPGHYVGKPIPHELEEVTYARAHDASRGVG